MAVPIPLRSVLPFVLLSAIALTPALAGDDAPSTDPVETDAAAQPAGDPWDVESPPRPFSPDCWRYSLGVDDPWTVERVQQWLRPVDSHPLKLVETKNTHGEAVTLSGLAQLRPAWPKDGVLRLTFSCPLSLAIHLWDGEQGVSLRQYRVGGRPTWAAYRLTRQPGETFLVDGQPLVTRDPGLALLTTDDQRDGHDAAGTYTVRWQDGAVVLAKGDRRLLTAPLNGHPQEVYLESPTALLRSLALYRGKRVPAADAPRRRIILHGELPSSLAWKEHLPADAQLRRYRDGHVRLSSQSSTDDAWIATPLLRAGLYEVIVHLEDVTPGTGMYFGDREGRPREGVQFFRDPLTGLTGFRLASGPADTTVPAMNWQTAPAPLAPRRPWLRLVLACGTLRCWTSADGMHWGQFEAPVAAAPAAYSHLVLHARASSRPRHIALRSLVVRQLDAIASLAPADLVERAVSLHLINAADAVGDLVPWQQRVLEHQADDVPTKTWRRACCIAALIDGASPPQANTMLDALLRETRTDAPSLDHHLRLLDDATLLYDARVAADAQRLAAHFDRLATSALVAEGADALDRVRRAGTRIPLWTPVVGARPLSESVARRAILRAAFSENVAWTDRLSRQLQFWNRPPDLLPGWHGGQAALKPLAEWGQARAGEAQEKRGAAKIIARPAGWRHPLAVDVSKEAFNVQMELQTALKQSSYQHAARNITSLNTVQTRGLVADTHDKRLYASLPQTIDAAVNDHPPLRRMMAEKFGPVARLRVNSAMRRNDEGAVSNVTICFRGMAAAGLAHRWLGDRDLSRGKFARALRHYDEALSTVGTVEKHQVAARRMLAAAMLGRRIDAKITRDIVYSGYTSTPDEFRRLIDEMIEQHGAGSSESVGPDSVPAPARYEVRPWAVLAGDVGVNPQPAPPASKACDWPARQMSTVMTRTTMIVSNRYQVTALRLSDAQVTWTYSLGAQQGPTHALPLVRMPLVLDAHRLYAVLLPKSGRRQLVCLDAGSGQVLWELPSSLPLLSDPVVTDGQLFFVTAETDERQQFRYFKLIELEPASGTVLREVILSDFRERKSAEPFCRLVAAGNDLLLAIESGLACCDTSGNLRWIRRVAWLPPALRGAGGRRHDRSLRVVDRDVYLAGPGMSGIECLDVDSGRRRWYRPVTDLRRLLSVDADRLLVETDRGILALKRDDGQRAWRYAADDLLDVVAANGEKHLLCIQQQRLSQRESTSQLVWLDRRTGRRVARFPLVDLRAATPRVGPLLSRGGRTWCFAGLFDAQGNLAPNRQVVELVAGGGDVDTSSTDRFSLWHGPADAAVSIHDDWIVTGRHHDAKTGLHKELAGRVNILVTQAATTPARLARFVKLPAKSPRRLVLEICAESSEASHVVVRVGGLPAGQFTLAAGKPGAWQTLEVDLSAFVGRKAWITLLHRPAGIAPSYAYWGKLSIEPLE
jgi:outer membrane protein assembly factor BamB